MKCLCDPCCHLSPGIIRLSEGFHDRYPVEDYLDLFDQAAYQIQGNLTANASGSPSQPNIIIGKQQPAALLWWFNLRIHAIRKCPT